MKSMIAQLFVGFTTFPVIKEIYIPNNLKVGNVPTYNGIPK